MSKEQKGNLRNAGLLIKNVFSVAKDIQCLSTDGIALSARSATLRTNLKSYAKLKGKGVGIRSLLRRQSARINKHHPKRRDEAQQNGYR